jgi:hypothetical protein
MTEKSKKMIQAIDLMLEDLQIKHGDIREQAKESKCEDELDEIKECLIEYLCELKLRYN